MEHSAGAAEFIDLLTSENKHLQLQLGGGIRRLDSTYTDRYGQTYPRWSSEQQKEMLGLIAFRKNGRKYPSLGY